jgi:methylmalonyl-CoA mutase
MADLRRPASSAEAPAFGDWRRAVEKSLKGRDFGSLASRTRDGILVEPLYPRRTDAPPLTARGARPWSIVQIVDDPDPDRANAQAIEDVGGGATGLALRFAGAPAAATSGLPPTAAALAIALESIDLAAIAVRIDPHPLGPTLARALGELALKQGNAPERAAVSFGLDPIGPAAFRGTPVENAGDCIATFAELHARGFRGALAELDSRVFHEAGASEAQELAAVLGAAAWWLRALEAAGIAAETALPCFGATLAVDRDEFLSIAKLRALRLLWARLAELCSAPGIPLRVHAETSRRMLTRADPHANILRATIAAFAAAAGGADSIAVLPFTAALGPADQCARAIARDMQHLLMEEAHLHRVADPAAGSGALEQLTDDLAAAAWAEFQAIEQEGGLTESMRLGAYPSRIASMRTALADEMASGKTPLVGATIYPDPSAGLPEAAQSGPSGPGLAPIRLGELARPAA